MAGTVEHHVHVGIWESASSGEWWNIANLHVHIAILKVLSGRKYSLVLDGDF